MASCGFREELRQRYEDAPLTVCPSCKSPTYRRVPTLPAAVLVAPPRVRGRRYAAPYVTHERDGSETVYGSEGEAYARERERTGSPALARKNVRHIRTLGYVAGSRQAARKEAITPLAPGDMVR